MELFSIKISFPVLRFDDVIIEYTSPKCTTAFERVLLNVCRQFANDEVYGEIPIQRIFEDILSVSNSGVLLERTIDELVNIQAVCCSTGACNIETLLLKSLSMTDMGRQLCQDGKLSAVPQKRRETFFYDPIEGKLVPDKSLRPKHEQNYIDAEPYMDSFPDWLIQEEITKSTRNSTWNSGQTSIESIKRSGEPVVLWRNTNVKFYLRNGLLAVKLPEEKYTEHLHQWDSKKFTKTFFNDFLSETEITGVMSHEDFEKLPRNNWNPANKNESTDAVLYRVPIRFNQETVELNIAVKQQKPKEEENERIQ